MQSDITPATAERLLFRLHECKHGVARAKQPPRQGPEAHPVPDRFLEPRACVHISHDVGKVVAEVLYIEGVIGTGSPIVGAEGILRGWVQDHVWFTLSHGFSEHAPKVKCQGGRGGGGRDMRAKKPLVASIFDSELNHLQCRGQEGTHCRSQGRGLMHGSSQSTATGCC